MSKNVTLAHLTSTEEAMAKAALYGNEGGESICALVLKFIRCVHNSEGSNNHENCWMDWSEAMDFLKKITSGEDATSQWRHKNYGELLSFAIWGQY